MLNMGHTTTEVNGRQWLSQGGNGTDRGKVRRQTLNAENAEGAEKAHRMVGALRLRSG